MQRGSQSRVQQSNSSSKQPSARLRRRCRSAGISTAAPATVMAPASDYKLRTYEHCTDRQHVMDICADVYGGTDYMPRRIDAFAVDQHVTMLVAFREGMESVVDGIVCCDTRGDTMFLYGLRVRTSCRGVGLGNLLMAAICSHRSPSPAHSLTSIVSVTTPENFASQRLIGKQLGSPVELVEVWPSWDSLAQYEKALGWAPASSSSHGAIVDQTSQLDFYPGARATLLEDKQAVALLPLWRNPASMEELAQAMVSVRREQQQVHHSSTHTGTFPHGSTAHITASTDLSVKEINNSITDISCGEKGKLPILSPSPPSWLPLCYEVIPLTSVWLQQQLAEKRVWVLPADKAEAAAPHSSQTRYLAAMVVAYSPEARRQSAGISCAGISASHSAILKASELQPHFCGFIHRGGLAFVDDPPPNPTASSKSAEVSESALAAADQARQLNVTRRTTALDKSMLPALYASTNGCNYYNIYRSNVASKL